MLTHCRVAGAHCNTEAPDDQPNSYTTLNQQTLTTLVQTQITKSYNHSANTRSSQAKIEALMALPQISPGMFFQLHLDIMHDNTLPAKKGLPVPFKDKYIWPLLGELAANVNLEVASGWNQQGVGVSFLVKGKKQEYQTTSKNPHECDGIILLIDTRNTRTISRGNRFCHQFLLMPRFPGSQIGQGKCLQLPIQNAREQAPQLAESEFKVTSEINKDGYALSIWFSPNQLNGFDPETSPKISTAILMRDQELGTNGYFISAEFPVQMDPSLWTTLNLKK